MFLLLSGCSGSSSSGANSDARVPLTENDRKAIAMLGGFGGEWLRDVETIIRLEQPPPPGTRWAKSWRSKCGEAFTIYQTSHDHPCLACLFVHESQHQTDGCKKGPEWEARANKLDSCWRNDIARNDCAL